MPLYDWNEDLCRAYANGLRPVVRFDHAPWAERIVRRLGALPPRSTVLDVATGPGFLLLEIGKRLPGTRLIAQDQAEPMLAIARREAERAGLRIETVCCPAEGLALPDASVDIVTCKQLLHEAADVDRTIEEMARVLQSPGTAFVVDFDAQGSRAAALATRAFLRLTRGALIARDFWRSFEAGVAGERVRDAMARSGFRTVEYQRVGFNYFVVGSR
jgi:ubiquinone/menaquinone biosynthesis C-methylase UbiE